MKELRKNVIVEKLGWCKYEQWGTTYWDSSQGSYLITQHKGFTDYGLLLRGDWIATFQTLKYAKVCAEIMEQQYYED